MSDYSGGRPVPQEPTIGEVYRLLVAMDKRLDGLVTAAVFKAEQDFSREQFRVLTRDLSDWKAESRGEHSRLDGRMNTLESEFDGKVDTVKAEIKAERDRADTIERTARAQNAQKWLSIGLAALAAVISIGGIIVNVVGG